MVMDWGRDASQKSNITLSALQYITLSAPSPIYLTIILRDRTEY